jgi:DNA-directed RNA polymerase specialized sigma24 family protein
LAVRSAAPATCHFLNDADRPLGALQSTRKTASATFVDAQMSTDSEGSVSHWIGALKEGDAEAAQRLWERYFDALVRLARAKLGAIPRRDADEEDVALSAFHSFCQGAADGRFPQLDDRYGLWRLLVKVTLRKALDQSERQRRKKRGGGRTRGESVLIEKHSDEREAGIEQIVGREPTPEFAAMVADECRRLLEALGDETLRRIAVLRMEGYGDAEIAAQLGCGLRTVGRKLELIRKAWQREAMP